MVSPHIFQWGFRGSIPKMGSRGNAPCALPNAIQGRVEGHTKTTLLFHKGMACHFFHKKKQKNKRDDTYEGVRPLYPTIPIFPFPILSTLPFVALPTFSTPENTLTQNMKNLTQGIFFFDTYVLIWSPTSPHDLPDASVPPFPPSFHPNFSSRALFLKWVCTNDIPISIFCPFKVPFWLILVFITL